MATVGEIAELAVVLKLYDKMTGPLRGVQAQVARATSGMDQLHRGVYKVGAGIGVAGRTIAGAAVGVGVFAGKLGVDAVQAAGKFQDQLNIINTIAQTTPDKLDAIGAGIRGLSRDTGASLDDLTSAYYDLLSAGIKVKDSQNALNLSYKLSQGALSTTGEAVDFLTTAINAYRLNQKQTTIVADQFAQAVADGKVKLSEISASFANVASVARTAGIGLDEIAAAYAHLTAQGVPAAEVTTEMNRAIVDLMKPNKDLIALQDKLHTNYLKIAGDKGLVVALQQMREDAKKAGIPFQDLFGRLEGYKFALQTTGPANAAFNAELQRIHGSAGALDKQFAERAQGFQYQWGRLKATIHDLFITTGAAILPNLSDTVKTLTDELGKPEIRQAVQDFGKALGSIFSPSNVQGAMQFARDILPSIRDGLSLTAKVAKGALDLFNSLPPELKTVAIAALVGNKLTGGLVASGIGDIAKGLLSQSLTGAVGGGGGGIVGGLLGVQKVYVVNMPIGGLGGGVGAGAANAEGAAVAGASTGSKVLGAVRVLGSVALAAVSIAALAEQFNTFQQQVGTAQQSLGQQVQGTYQQNVNDSIANLNATVSGLNNMNVAQRGIANTFGGGQITQDIVNAAARLSVNATSQTQLVASRAAVAGALAYAKSNGLDSAVQPLEQSLNLIDKHIVAGNPALQKVTNAVNASTTKISKGLSSILGGVDKTASGTAKAATQYTATGHAIKGAVDANKNSTAAKLGAMAGRLVSQLLGVKGATNQVQSTLRAKKLSVAVNNAITVATSVSVSTVQHSTTSLNRYRGKSSTTAI